MNSTSLYKNVITILYFKGLQMSSFIGLDKRNAALYPLKHLFSYSIPTKQPSNTCPLRAGTYLKNLNTNTRDNFDVETAAIEPLNPAASDYIPYLIPKIHKEVFPFKTKETE